MTIKEKLKKMEKLVIKEPYEHLRIEELKQLFDKDELAVFGKWMDGQTIGWDTENNTPMYYAWDVEKFIKNKPENSLTWD